MTFVLFVICILSVLDSLFNWKEKAKQLELVINRSVISVIINLISCFLVIILAAHFFSRSYSEKICKLDNLVKEQLALFDSKVSYQLQIHELSFWNRAAIIALELYKNDINFCIEPKWAFLFRRSMICKDTAEQILHVAPVGNKQIGDKPAAFVIGRDVFWFDLQNSKLK